MHPAEDTESSDDEYDGTSTGIDERDGTVQIVHENALQRFCLVIA